MGKVSTDVWEKIELANEGKLPQSTCNFNILTSRDGKFFNYTKAYVINGYCRFKKYGLLDTIKYKVARLLGVGK